MTIKDWDLVYWSTGEWQVVQERLKDDPESNPPHHLRFAALGTVLPSRCKVAILGQDPYPRREHCTGIAFSTPRGVTDLPPTLINIFKEYHDDLGFTPPEHGDLTQWCEQGVLLWNVYPTCSTGKPGSHHWPEWEYLTKEILEKLDGTGSIKVFVFLGSVAGSFSKYVSRCPIIRTSHPSPLGARKGFLGSRIFTRINNTLEGLNQPKIDWRL